MLAHFHAVRIDVFNSGRTQKTSSPRWFHLWNQARDYARTQASDTAAYPTIGNNFDVEQCFKRHKI